MTQIALLGPQRDQPTVGSALQHIGGGDRVAVISAGWQEREGELDDLSAQLGSATLTDLRLYERTEEIFRQDQELFEAWRQRQDWLIEQQRLYRVRLRHGYAAAQELAARDGEETLIAREKQHALAAVRDLDRHHLREVRRVHFQHWRRWQPAQRPLVAVHRAEIIDEIEKCDCLLVAGGHISVLLNRLRLYDIGPLVASKNIIAWSAGAMALSERVLLFHDKSPHGKGHPEILDAGLGIYRGVVALPDAHNRLALDDPSRVSILAERITPAAGIALDEPSMMLWDGQHWHAHGPTRVLRPTGELDLVAA